MKIRLRKAPYCVVGLSWKEDYLSDSRALQHCQELRRPNVFRQAQIQLDRERHCSLEQKSFALFSFRIVEPPHRKERPQRVWHLDQTVRPSTGNWCYSNWGHSQRRLKVVLQCVALIGCPRHSKYGLYMPQPIDDRLAINQRRERTTHGGSASSGLALSIGLLRFHGLRQQLSCFHFR